MVHAMLALKNTTKQRSTIVHGSEFSHDRSGNGDQCHSRIVLITHFADAGFVATLSLCCCCC